MSPPIVRHWITRIGLIGGTALVLAGCPEDAANITEFASAPSWDFPVAGAYLDPAGEASVDNFILAAIDPSVTDAFARTQSFLTSAASFFTCGGDCPAWEFPVRNGSQDTRLPALQDNDATGDLGITPDSIFGDPFAVYTFAGLPANGSFTVTLERLALTVNGDLDHVNNLLNNPDFGGFQKTPDAPDGLTPLGGSPGTTLGSNPYTIGGFTTDAGGLSGFNFFAFDGGGTNDIIETNSLAAFDLPQYNYLVIYDDATGLPVMRAQVGVDLDATGAPINNALAPFPVDPLTPSDVLAAPGGAGRPDVITVTYNGLQDLAGGAEYQAWLLNTGTGSFVPAVGDYNRIKILAEFDPVTGEVIATRDSVVETVTGVSSFVGGNQSDDVGVGFRHQLAVSDAT
ncbi:MAG: hypothetical protein JSU87_08180, partial [Gemmatimonadota bacterium]